MATVAPDGGMAATAGPAGDPRLSLSEDGSTVSVRFPLALRKRGSRKIILGPDGAAPVRSDGRHRVDAGLVNALARAHRWQRMIDSRRFATIGDLARAEKINPSYLSRVLRLTLLAPGLVEAILDGPHKAVPTHDRLMRPFPAEWVQQFAATP